MRSGRRHYGGRCRNGRVLRCGARVRPGGTGSGHVVEYGTLRGSNEPSISSYTPASCLIMLYSFHQVGILSRDARWTLIVDSPAYVISEGLVDAGLRSCDFEGRDICF